MKKTMMLAGACALACAIAPSAIAQTQDSGPQYSTPTEQAQTRALNEDAVDGTTQSPGMLNGGAQPDTSDDAYPQYSGYGGDEQSGAYPQNTRGPYGERGYPQQGSYSDRDQNGQYPAQYPDGPAPRSAQPYNQQLQRYREQQLNYEDQSAQYHSDSAQYREDLRAYDRAVEDDGPYTDDGP
jgi:hypothetical protein